MANLNPSKSWKKGQSGNLKGRPQESWAKTLQATSESYDKKCKKTYKQLVSEKLWKLAISGDISAMKILMERMEGRPTQVAEIIENRNTAPIITLVSYADYVKDNKSESEAKNTLTKGRPIKT